MLKNAQGLLKRLAAPVAKCCQDAQAGQFSESLLRGFAVMALQGQGAEAGVQAARDASFSSSSSSTSQQAALPGQQTSPRGMAYGYARLPQGKNYVHHVHESEFGHTMLTDYLIKVVPKFIKFGVVGPAQSSVLYQEPTVFVAPEHLPAFMLFLRDHVNTQFKCLLDVTAVDFPERAARFEVVYHLLSPRWNNRIRVKVAVDELTPVPSISHIHKSANWFERETWDMFGVFFTNHPDLRRILTDYGFTGHPLRKDFPLSGYTEVRYDYGKKRVISEPLELTQEFRYFDFASPWDTLPR